PEVVARHYECAGDKLSAATLYARASRAALWRGDLRTILRCSERALELGLAPAEQFNVRVARAEALGAADDAAAAAHELEAALLVAPTERDRALALVELGMSAMRAARSDHARTSFEAAARAAQGAGDPACLARAWAGVGLGALYAG